MTARRKAAALAAFVAASVAWGSGCGRSHAPADVETPARAFSLEGLVLSEFAGAKLQRRLRADQLLVVPKRMGIFQVAGLNELVLTRARLEVFEADERAPRGGGATGAVSRGTLDVVSAGRRIASASIHGLECEIVRSGELRTRISAARGRVDIRSGDVILEEFSLTELRPSSRSIRGAKAVWRVAEQELVVSGPYELRDGARVTTGRGLRLDLHG